MCHCTQFYVENASNVILFADGTPCCCTSQFAFIQLQFHSFDAFSVLFVFVFPFILRISKGYQYAQCALNYNMRIEKNTKTKTKNLCKKVSLVIIHSIFPTEIALPFFNCVYLCRHLPASGESAISIM